MGIDFGRVLVFELGPGARDIAGSPVNVASKLTHDCGRFGSIWLTDAVASRAPATEVGRRLSVEISGVAIAGYEI